MYNTELIHHIQPQQVTPTSLHHSFIIVLIPFGTIDEYQQTPLFRKLQERNMETVTSERLSDPRLVYLFSSYNLLEI